MFEHLPFSVARVINQFSHLQRAQVLTHGDALWFQLCHRDITDIPIQIGPGPAIPISTSEQPHLLPTPKKNKCKLNQGGHSQSWGLAPQGCRWLSWQYRLYCSPQFALCGAHQAVGPGAPCS